MEEDFYGGISEPKKAPEKEREESDVETALLPKSIFPSGKEPKAGKKCKFEVVHVYDDEVEVKYVKSKDKDDDKDDDDKKSDPDDDDAFAKYDDSP